MRHLTVLRLAVPVAAALLVAGCTDKTDPGPPPTRPVALGDTAEPVWTVRAAAMSQPGVKDGVVVAYVAVPDPQPTDAAQAYEDYDPTTYRLQQQPDQVLTIIAWDAQDGTELWRHDAVPGNDVHTSDDGYADAPWVDVTEVGGSLVVDYLVGDPDSDGTLVATADLHTGQETRYGPAVHATNRPSSCDHDAETGVCLKGTFVDEPASHTIQLDEASATLVPGEEAQVESPVPDGAKQLGSGVFAVDDQLGYADDDGEVLWTRGYQDVMGPGSSVHGVWGWARRDDGSLLGVGSLSLVGPVDYDAATVMRTVVLSAETGETVWSVAGTLCNRRLTSADTLAVCVDSGTVSISDQVTYSGHGRYVVGVDAATGAQKWRYPAEGDVPVVGDDSVLPAYPFLRSGNALVVEWTDNPQVVDMTTGEATALPSDSLLLCDSTWDHVYQAKLTVGGAGSAQRMHDRSVTEVCDTDGMPTEALSWPAYFVKAALSHDEDDDGKDDDGVYVVATPGQIAAFRL